MSDLAQPQPIYRQDYAPPSHWIDAVELRFELDPRRTVVESRLTVRRNPDHVGDDTLWLNGEGLELLSVARDGEPLGPDAYALDARFLRLPGLPEQCTLTIRTAIDPAANTELEGLYVSRGIFCTQCEAEGFRRITYFLDRPDVMARYRVTLVADPEACPVLLANGNCIEDGTLADGRHWALWEDPFPKPSYLFALVAGRLDHVEARHRTPSGRDVRLRIYSEPGKAEQCRHALDALQKAMRWDETTFGLECDLDLYNVVAISDFNMGAMENKGLNVFNDRYILADAASATDVDYENIENVVAHEYFHNWTGNRITLRDWFQLSLKEGLTVYRDQRFSQELAAKTVKRIDDVRILQAHQFPEDAGPMAHPVRPESYIEMNNFYTATVYQKGAEVVRMYETLFGTDGFRRGMDLYVQRHDGQAITCDDFRRAMADANGADLAPFERWYDQAGTPEVAVTGEYDADARTYTLHVTQSCPPTPGQAEKQPFLIPVAMGLLGADGRDLPLRLAGEDSPQGTTRVLALREAAQSFTFVDVPEEPTPSLLRGFSAPVRLRFPYTRAQRAFLMGHDADEFNRWQAGQDYAMEQVLENIEAHRSGTAPAIDPAFLAAMERILADPELDPGLAAECLTLPSEAAIAECMKEIDPAAIHASREALRLAIAEHLRERLLARYELLQPDAPYRYDPATTGPRRLKNVCLAYLTALGDSQHRQRALAQFEQADNMTDAMAALQALNGVDCPERTAALARFEERWRHEALVMDKWFTLQATAPLPGTLDTVRRLMDHPAFDFHNPNKVRALIGAFCRGNPLRFHDPDGAGYVFLADQALALDRINPQIAARLGSILSQWRRFESGRRGKMREQLERMRAAPRLSPDLYEIVAKSLDSA